MRSGWTLTPGPTPPKVGYILPQEEKNGISDCEVFGAGETWHSTLSPPLVQQVD